MFIVVNCSRTKLLLLLVRTVTIHVYSWTVLRSQCITEETSLKSVETEVCRNMSNTDDWCSDADDWDVDNSNAYCVRDAQKSVNSSTCSEQIVSAAANVGCNDASLSALIPLQDAVAVISSKHSDISSDEPVQLLMNLAIDKDSQKSTKTCTYTVSESKVEFPNKSYESTSTVTAELEQYYIYVMEECSSDNHSDHVDDLLIRYSLQEGSNFKAELEYRNCTYVN